MRKTRLGKTELIVTKNSFGALPIQRLSFDEAARLMRNAYEGGINFFDTAHGYTNSEEKIGFALSDVRQDIYIATKTPGKTAQEVREHTLLSLERMKTDYIDIQQFHNPKEVPLADSPLYQELVKLKQEGKIRHIGITSHKLENAILAIESGLYETVQYPLSCLSSDEEFEMVRLAKKHDVGIICMKAMCGGMLTSAAPSMAVLDQFDHAVPIFGMQKQSELDEVLALDANPPRLDGEIKAYIEKERKELGNQFCRGCGYCMPCPVGIEINMAARMKLFLNRAVWQQQVTPEAREKMMRIENCLHCGACKKRCPYGLDCPSMLAENLEYYKNFLKEKGID